MQQDPLDDLYQEIVLDHYKSPRNRRTLPDPQLKAEGYNPFCGDRVVFTAQLDEAARISSVGCIGEGCAISQASASIMTELLKGQTVERAKALAERFREIMRGEKLTAEEEEALGDLVALEGVRKFPIRIKCALLAWVALQDAITEHGRWAST